MLKREAESLVRWGISLLLVLTAAAKCMGNFRLFLFFSFSLIISVIISLSSCLCLSFHFFFFPFPRALSSFSLRSNWSSNLPFKKHVYLCSAYGNCMSPSPFPLQIGFLAFPPLLYFGKCLDKWSRAIVEL